jgi:hypothetical protein
MIFGFAHLAVNVHDLLAAEVVWQAEGYARSAIYLSAPNHPSKQRFLSIYHPSHELMLLAGSGLWPLELTCHGHNHSVNKQLKWGRESIHITVPDTVPLRRLLIEGLGFLVGDDDTLILESRFLGWSCRLRLQVGGTLPVSLNATGPTCLAFYCNRIEEDAQRLIDLGATDSTGTFDIILGERNMKIAMLRAPGGILIELISPKKI